MTAFVLACGVAYAIGESFAAPMPAVAGDPPFDLVCEQVSFPSESGSTISAWHYPADNAAAGVVLLHGVRSNRRGMVNRVPFLHEAGYSVLVIDFQAHGESPGDHITFGYRESNDARAAVAWLHAKLPGKKIGVIGASMGGAASLLAGEQLKADAVILETVYATIDDAVDNRMRENAGPIGPMFSWVLLMQMKPRLGFSPAALRPIDGIASLHAPVFVIAGEIDAYTPLAESRRLFDRAREPKEFWVVPGAAHVDIFSCAEEQYTVRVRDFFARYLNTDGS
jgi:fermentation-respiration switch protein FrsA (DUF1100 family)